MTVSKVRRNRHKKRSISSNIRKKGVSTRQIDRIRTLSHEGKSTNQIQRTLSKEGIGLRRQTMLQYVREFRQKAPKANTAIYTRTKYRKARARREYKREYNRRYRLMRKRRVGEEVKSVTVTDSQHGEPKSIEIIGIGRDDYEAIKQYAYFHPPRKQFLTISAAELLSNPNRYLSEGGWDGHPRINS